ncbi:MAG: hypothetical protein KJ686_12935 [Actinobacteria bacterium]|nr:hypothetical protein [Actinomycetota bacterium]
MNTKKHPLKPKLPKIKADKYSILVTIFSTKEKFKGGGFKLNERQKKAIEYTRKVGKITNAEYQKINKTMKKTATRDLQNLVRREILIKKGRTGKGGKKEEGEQGRESGPAADQVRDRSRGEPASRGNMSGGGGP